MKLWLCGDHHTGTTYFYETFLNLSKATKEKHFSTTAAKEFTPNHFSLPKQLNSIIPQTFENQYDDSSPFKEAHEKFIRTASNYRGGVKEGWNRLENMFACYSGINTLASEPTNQNFETLQFKFVTSVYDDFLAKHNILLLFIIRNPVDLECSRWIRKLTHFTNERPIANLGKNQYDNSLKEFLKNSHYLDKIKEHIECNEKFIVDYFPQSASTFTRHRGKKPTSSYFSYYNKLIKLASTCRNIKITTYEILFTDTKKSIREMIRHLNPSGIDCAELSQIIDQIKTHRINSCDKRLICSDRVKAKMKSIHIQGFSAWEELSRMEHSDNIFLY